MAAPNNTAQIVAEEGLGGDRKASRKITMLDQITNSGAEEGLGGDRKASQNKPWIDQILVGDVIQSRKSHPCGSDKWTVIRTGADIKMKCNGCGRIVMLDRDSFLRRRKAVLTRGAAASNLANKDPDML